ncbi:hypothetical protein NDU88_004996 [Pleurodeles waltl]|uniref:Uncharacterized protein n=1 Tax=Pleurodeles waltl TaxID=8319 RepID=A0AAV7LLF1_PLEWA|nr:hypothetical protein NDU88_004996 [Pleurodeles waltl]
MLWGHLRGPAWHSAPAEETWALLLLPDGCLCHGVRAWSCASQARRPGAHLADPLGAADLMEARLEWPWVSTMVGSGPDELGERRSAGRACPLPGGELREAQHTRPTESMTMATMRGKKDRSVKDLLTKPPGGRVEGETPGPGQHLDKEAGEDEGAPLHQLRVLKEAYKVLQLEDPQGGSLSSPVMDRRSKRRTRWQTVPHGGSRPDKETMESERRAVLESLGGDRKMVGKDMG